MFVQVASGAAANSAAAAREQGQFRQGRMVSLMRPPGSRLLRLVQGRVLRILEPAWAASIGHETGSAYARTGRRAHGQRPEGPLVPLIRPSKMVLLHHIPTAMWADL